MGWRYRWSFRVAPGIRLNMGKRGSTSVSVGRSGFTLNFGKRGVTNTVSLPGTGLSYQHRFLSPASSSRTVLPQGRVRGHSVKLWIVLAVLVSGYIGVRGSPRVPTETSHVNGTAPAVSQSTGAQPDL